MIRRLVPALIALFLVGTVVPASANPEKKFSGKVLLSDKRFPTSAKSASAYVAALRKQAKTRFQEDKDKQAWKIHFAAFMKKAPPDIQVQVRILDATTRPATLVTVIDQFLDNRGQRAVLSSFTLERKHVGVNRNLVIQVEADGAVLASGKFSILGEAVRYTGQVDFSDDDTK